MKRSGIVAVVACVGLLVAGLQPARAAEAVVENGGFETPYSEGTFTTRYAGDTSMAPWEITGSVDHIGSYWEPAEGDMSLDLNGNDPGSISQDIATVAGETYTLTFQLSGNPAYQSVVSLDVYWDEAVAGVFTFDTAGRTFQDMGWRQESLQLTASSETTRLEFKATSGGPVGAALDAISLGADAAPEDPCETDPEAICGDEGDNEIEGTPEDDTIYAGDGDDTIDGGGGNDVIVGGDGNDTLTGGGADDQLLGGEGDDVLVGDSVTAHPTVQGRRLFGPFLQEEPPPPGNDMLDGGGGNDTVDGSLGNDTVKGGAGVDTVVGGGGKDNVTGQAGSDDLAGSSGPDVLNGGAGTDGMNGGSGEDTCVLDTRKEQNRTRSCEKKKLNFKRN